jgi:hypothetical protein
MVVIMAADASGGPGTGAVTKMTPTSTGEITGETDDKGKVIAFTNTIAYAVTIQTTYGSGDPDDECAYGRGTTPGDQQAGNITIGFHEACHRADYLSQLTTKAVPKFKGKKDMAQKDFQEQMDKYDEAWDKYFEEIGNHTLNVTDEVGDPTRTQFCAANPNRCP